MKSIVKKTIIYSMIGMIEMGFGASAVFASPVYSYNGPQQIVQLDDRHDRDNDRWREQRRHEEERRREHDERLRRENERHEREMQRRRHESEREWHERQERERQRHDETLHEIAALLIGIAIGSANK
ncbi:Hypothetical protein LUCI_2563 [Lucifera butyrica]|uniref:Uncharacterized protein n=1 Tax=Lucifera butyrica TaxID=1351585 RepID=A0A498R807_9FIRM|nr:hypothetical protein [Lucifera butyrica]VBB07319.1 Hypothetical protein LUCI_2563 [Lucifera butyrica]